MHVQLRLGTASVEGWESRHCEYPRIRHAMWQAGRRDNGFLLLFRGDQKRPPHLEHIFEIGQKARAAYHSGDLAQVGYHPRKLAEDKESFARIARAFAATRMATLTEAQLVERYQTMDLRDRFWLSQLLLEGLQYQNCRREVRAIRDLLFVVSFSLREEVALRFALSFREGEVPPQEAYVLEYAPPVRGNYFHKVADVIARFRDFNLGSIYPDKDDEVFVLYAALPHYLLGYTRLDRIQGEGNVYGVEYTPNPRYAEGEATLDMPPDLDEAQRSLMRETVPGLAWVAYDPDANDWGSLITGEGVSPLGVPRDTK